jgi:SRSO17 transposase
MIACLHDQDRQAMQKSTGQSPRHHRPLIAELAQQVGGEQGQPDGVLVFDPSAFRKQGKHSVGVARQWCGRMGKIDNCQVRVYLGYVSRIEHALLDVRLYLNKDWAKDKKRAHCQAADLPSDDEAPGDPHFIGTSTSEPSNVAPTEARSLPASASRHNCTSA